MKYFFTKVILVSVLLSASLVIQAQCPTNATIEVCNSAGGNGTIRVYFLDGTAPIDYILFRISPSPIQPVTVPFGPVTVTSIPAGTAVAAVQFDFVPNGTYILQANCSPSGSQNYGGFGIVVNSANAINVTSTLLHPDCNPDPDTGNGQLRLTATGGVPPYSVSWSGTTTTIPSDGSIASSGGTLTTSADLDAGTYTATITDANNCVFVLNNIAMPVATQSDAGEDDATCETSYQLQGNPAGAGEEGTWTVLSGSGSILPADIHNKNATATGLSVGLNRFRWTIVDAGGVCTPGSSDEVDIIRNPLPTAGISYLGTPFCATGTATVTRTGQAGGTYSSTTGLVIDGTTGTINLATSSAPGTYTVTYSFTDGTCPNTTTTSVTIQALPNAPTGVDVTACFDGSAHTGSATAGAGETIVWYTAATGGSVTTAPGGTAVGTYTAYAASKNTTTNCESGTRTQVTVTIQALPNAPTGVDVTACFDGSAHTGSATAGAGETIVWYTAATNGSITSAPNGTAAGIYTAFAAAQNTITGCESATRTQVTVTINALPAVTITAGATTICEGNSSTYATQAGQNNYQWNVTGGTITAGGGTNDNTATIQWTASGTVTVNYENGNGCAAIAPASRAVTVDAIPTAASAGSNVSGACGTVTLAANMPTVGTGSWGFAPAGNPGGGSFVTPSSPTSGFNGVPGTTYTLRWTISNGTCTASFDDVVIAFDPAGVTPASAGTDQTKCNDGSFTLAGNTPASGTGTWSVISGTANITDTSSPTSAVTGIALGSSATLRWSISNGSCTSTDDVTLYNNNSPSAADAGPDQAVCGTSATLAAVNPAIGTGAWTIQSGTGGTVTTPSANNSGFTGTAGETYVLRWTVSNGACSPDIDEVTLTLDETPSTALAGPDILNACGTLALDANSPAVGTGQWSFASGGNPDNLGVIADVSDPDSDFNGSSGVTYVLTWTISNGSCTGSSDDVTIQYSPTGPTPANAGPDQVVCGTSTTLSANIPIVGIGQWSFAVGGNPGNSGSIADINDQTSGFTGAAGQTYVLIWTISSGACSSQDQVTIQFNSAPTVANAGPDQSICGTSTTLAANSPAIGTGAWSFATGGNPDGLGVIANTNDRLSGFSGTQGQTYVLTWTISSGGCTPSTNDVEIAFSDVSLTAFNTSYCQNGGNVDLTSFVSATPAGGTLTFAGTQVTGSTLDPTGLTGVQSIAVQYVKSGCTLTTSLLVNILAPTNPACSGGGGGCSVPVISKTDACNGNDGQINITSVSGGVSPYVFSIDNGANWTTTPGTTASFTNLAGGSYAVLVKDNNGCISTVNTIVIAYKISGTIAKTDVTTCSGTDGTITFSNVQGGTSGTYVYSVDGGTSFQSGAVTPSGIVISGLASGTYSAIIKENIVGGCISAPMAFTIALPGGCTGGAVPIPVISKIDACHASDGAITITSVSGGVAPYTFSLDNGVTFTATAGLTFTSPPLEGGRNYAVIVKDNIGAVSSVYTIFIGYAISGSITKTDATTCTGTDGKVTFSNIQGTSSYNLIVLNSASAPVGTVSGNTVADLAPGSYTALIQDTSPAGCTSPAMPFTIALPAGCGGTTPGNCAAVVITPVPSPATCTNSDGSITFNFVPALNPATPVGPNGVKLSITGVSGTNQTISRTNFNDALFTGLPMGTYSYTIEYGDASCTKTGQVTIDQSGTVGTPVVVANSIVGPVCAGDATGVVTLDVPGETGNVLEWSLDGTTWNQFTAGNQITGIPAGSAPLFKRVISVRRNSSDPCFAAIEITMQDQFDPIVASYTILQSVSCGNNDGEMEITSLTGGSGPYTVSFQSGLFSPAAIPMRFTGLSAGDKTIAIKDSKGCVVSETVKLTSPNSVILLTSPPAVHSPSCEKGGTDGEVVITIDKILSKTTGPYQYGIGKADQEESTVTFRAFPTGNTFLSELTVDTLTSGKYYVLLKPATGCLTRYDFEITGGAQAVDFDVDRICNLNEQALQLTEMTGDEAAPLDVLIFNKFNGARIDSIRISSFPVTGSYLIENKSYLSVNGEFNIVMVQQEQIFCTTPVRSSLKTFNMTSPLSIQVTDVQESFPDIATGLMEVSDFFGGLAPYYTRIEMDSAASLSLTSFETEFEEVGLNLDSKLEKVYDNIPPGRYMLQVTDSLGCSIEKMVRIPMDKDIFIPNIFTPNEDGLNDQFFIRNLPQSESASAKLVITSRWGKEVFRTDNYKNDWKGEGAADGIYFYTLQIKDTEPFTGWVEILRGQKP